MKFLSIVMTAMLWTLQAGAEDVELQRSAFLGVIPASPAQGQPVIVASLHPAGSAQALGVLEGDAVLTVNGQEVPDYPTLARITGQVRAGETLSLTVRRDGAVQTLTGAVAVRPLETGDGYSVTYGQFEWQDNHIRSIVYTPDTPRPDGAAVMYIQGYTCGSIDYGMVPDLTLNQVLATYAKAGFTVFKMEKPGIGDSVGPLRCDQYDFHTENAAFQAGLMHFKTLPGVNGDAVFVLGHSLGVLHSAVLASKGLIAGAMGYGGVVKSWHEYLTEIYAKQSVKYWGVSQAQADDNVRTIKPLLADWILTDRDWNEVLADPKNKEALEADLLPIRGDQVFDRHYSFFRSVNAYDFRQLWAQSTAYVLMMHGGYDIQAIESGWQDDIAAIVNAQHPGTATALVFPRTEHAMMRYPDLAALRQAMSEGTHRAGNPGDKYNPDIASQSLAWMQHILDQQKN
ncbi:hypothetical protein GCM10017044_12270 [Kordiimonas sediminis]|uniref:PDZ domain-containing protein n=1 Tax=Kordiimonas sediminis TaxID=1735581 RepID=A0A919AQ11_9PROT|nr:PDZ domain-containing protein [Kordiimonas sediminis]GHF19261.1 hypothetical protein GCM10017044_12270 [Kordiimonas sediminis]